MRASSPAERAGPAAATGPVAAGRPPTPAGPGTQSGPGIQSGPGTQASPVTGASPVIEAAALTKVYPGGVTALAGLTVAFAPGVTGLIGANGAGKSTLIKVLLGLLEPTQGMAKVLGYDCVKDGLLIRRLVGYMPEHDCLPADISATEFVTHMGRMSGLPATAARERAAEALRHVGLHEERYRPIGTYSTGMKQRVKLAQALAGDPRLLLLDEPTNGLDPAGRNAMLELIARIGAEFGIPIVVASHLLGEIERICDGLVAIEAGQLLRADTIGSFTQASQTLLIEVTDGTVLADGPVLADGTRVVGGTMLTGNTVLTGNTEALHAELARRGLRARPFQQALLVPIEDDGTYDVVRDAVAALGLPLSRLERRRHQVEEIFRADQRDHPGRDQAMEAADAY